MWNLHFFLSSPLKLIIRLKLMDVFSSSSCLSSCQTCQRNLTGLISNLPRTAWKRKTWKKPPRWDLTEKIYQRNLCFEDKEKKLLLRQQDELSSESKKVHQYSSVTSILGKSLRVLLSFFFACILLNLSDWSLARFPCSAARCQVVQCERKMS